MEEMIFTVTLGSEPAPHGSKFHSNFSFPVNIQFKFVFSNVLSAFLFRVFLPGEKIN